MLSLDQVGTNRREYSLTTGRKISQTLLAGVLFVAAGFFLKLAVNPIGRDFVLAIGGIPLILGIILIAQAWASRLILDADRIEVRSAFRTHKAAFAEIEGFRKTQNQYGRWTRIYLKQELGSFNVSEFFTGNDKLQDWLKELPDLDRRDADEIVKQVNRQEMLAQEGTGVSKTLRLAKAWAIALSVLTAAVSLPVIFVSYAPIYRTSLVALLVCPIAGILLLRFYPLLFTVFRRKPDPRADLGFFLIWPGMGILLSYQTSNDPTHLINTFQLIYWVLAVFALMLISIFFSVWKSPSRWNVLFFFMIAGGMYSIGLVNSVNTLLDHAPSHAFGTQVLKKGEGHTSKGTTYFLRVAPWGPITYPEDVNVPMHTYNMTRVGDQVCYDMHPGFLHGPWYVEISCSEQTAPHTP